jgi:glycosyltransferase involved in cell wall biosynthesis
VKSQSISSESTSSVTVSVVIPVHNNARLALRALGSVLRQDSDVYEVILIDDASRLADRQLLERAVKRCKSSTPITIEKLDANVGPGLARHMGAALASGEFVAFLDADDQWHKAKIRLVGAEIRRSGSQLVGHKRRWSFSVRATSMAELPNAIEVRRLKRISFFTRNPIPTSSVVVERSIATTMFKFGGRKAEDYMALILASGMANVISYLDADLCWAHKPPFGFSGEGADQAAIYKASYSHMRFLYRAKYVSSLEFALFTIILMGKVPLGMVRYLRFKIIYASRRIG